jgi:hypothetical protein
MRISHAKCGPSGDMMGPEIAQLHSFATFETYFTTDGGVVFLAIGCVPCLIYKFNSLLQK